MTVLALLVMMMTVNRLASQMLQQLRLVQLRGLVLPEVPATQLRQRLVECPCLVC